MKLITKLIIIILILSFSPVLKAQNANITHQGLYWTRYYNQLAFNSKTVWHNEFDNRTFFQNNVHQSFLINSHLHYRLNSSVDVALGLTYSLQSPQDPLSTKTLVVPEIRPFQEITLYQPLSKRMMIQNRFRLEERYVSKNDGTMLLEGSDFNFRFRYRCQISINLSKIESKTPTALKISDELMLNAGGNIVLNRFDQNRFYIGVEKTFSKPLSVELGYMRWFQQRNTGYDFFERDILRLTIYHRINLKK